LTGQTHAVAQQVIDAGPGEPSAIERSTIRKINLRIIPFLIVCYAVSQIDRSNIGFAATEIIKSFSLSNAQFGLAGGLFFVAYLLCEVPSNLALEKFGARRWIARIMITWGLASAGIAFVVGVKTFMLMRFVLGAAEAGFFPGVVLYMTYWYPRQRRAQIVGVFMLAIPISGIVSSPISGWLMGLSGWLGLMGWQWLFIVEGLPAVLLGLVTLWFLTDRPAQAKWLSPDQRTWLVNTLEAEAKLASADRGKRAHVWRVLFSKEVLLLGLIYSSTASAVVALNIWQPIIIKSFGLSYGLTGWLNAIPYIPAAFFMVWWGHRSDRSGERFWHNVNPMLWMVVGMVGILFVKQLPIVLVLLTLVTVGIYANKGPFWAYATEVLSGGLAAGIAMINAFSQLMNFFMNYLIGMIKDQTGSFPLALTPILVLGILGIVAMFILNHTRKAT